VVITTIMFNFIASSLLVYLLVNVLRPAGSMAVETAAFAASAKLPSMQDALAALGIEWDAFPLNTSLILALLASPGGLSVFFGVRALVTVCGPSVPAKALPSMPASTYVTRSSLPWRFPGRWQVWWV